MLDCPVIVKNWTIFYCLKISSIQSMRQLTPFQFILIEYSRNKMYTEFELDKIAYPVLIYS